MAPSRERRLSQEEFSQLLARAAERHTLDAGKNFTLAELIEAGGELEIDSETVRAVYAEHVQTQDAAEARLAKQAQSGSVMRPLPSGSRLGVAEEGQTLIIGMPPTRGGKVIAALGSVVGLGIIGIAATAHGVPWYLRLGFGVVVGAIIYLANRSARMGHELHLRHDGGGALIRVFGSRGKAIMLKAGQVTARLDEHISQTQSGVRRSTYVALDHGADTFELMGNYARSEQTWVVERIRRWLGQSPTES
ncbi:MAG TPA: hypothetical protein VGF45_01960 [Polyangia bacterium]